jgi:hypothetical protein
MSRAQRSTRRPGGGRSRGGSRWLVGIALVVLAAGGVIAFFVLRPGTPRPTFASLAVGACLDLPVSAVTPAPATPTPVPVEPGASPTPGPSPSAGPPDDPATAAILAGEAVRVGCSERHTHEVVGTTGIKIGDAFQGRALLLQIAAPACSSSFADYVGHPVDGSQLALTIVVPDAASWAAGQRRAVCLASRADGTATTRSFKGSGL